MRKGEFEELAGAIYRRLPAATYSESYRQGFLAAVGGVIEAIESLNPQFDRSYFVQRCGLATRTDECGTYLVVVNL
jgi:hypothetical protein